MQQTITLDAHHSFEPHEVAGYAFEELAKAGITNFSAVSFGVNGNPDDDVEGNYARTAVSISFEIEEGRWAIVQSHRNLTAKLVWIPGVESVTTRTIAGGIRYWERGSELPIVQHVRDEGPVHVPLEELRRKLAGGTVTPEDRVLSYVQEAEILGYDELGDIEGHTLTVDDLRDVLNELADHRAIVEAVEKAVQR